MATAMTGRGKTVLGLFVDGLDIKLAHLAVHKRHIVIEELKSATLVAKIHDRKLVEENIGALVDSTDAFSIPSAPPPEAAPETVKEDNNAVLLGLIANYPRSKYSLTYSLAEPAIYYHVLESDFGLKGKRLNDRILAELKNIRAFQPAPDAVDVDPDRRREPPLHRARGRAEPDQRARQHQGVHRQPYAGHLRDRQR